MLTAKWKGERSFHPSRQGGYSEINKVREVPSGAKLRGGVFSKGLQIRAEGARIAQVCHCFGCLAPVSHGSAHESALRGSDEAGF